MKLTSYKHTICASCISYTTQAIINNYAPLLFLTFASGYGLTLDKITLITTVNFIVQLLVDLVSTKLIDKLGYRASVTIAHVFAAAGLIGMYAFTSAFADFYSGLMLSVVLYAMGGGLLEVLVSPIVEACPTENKEASMSFLHSFYCWGQVGVICLSTAFFAIFGIHNWGILALVWAIVPIFNIFYFLKVPLYPIVAEGEKMPLRGLLGQKVFWLLMVIMVCAGASELAMSQWASSFAEQSLHLSKSVGDLAGMCSFAALMGISRILCSKFAKKISLRKIMIFSAVLCVACYLIAGISANPLFGLIGCAVCGFSVGIFWPGTFSIAAARLPSAGTAMYALMALAGDVGCCAGPTLVGMVANANNGSLSLGLLCAVVFPLLIFVGTIILKENRAK